MNTVPLRPSIRLIRRATRIICAIARPRAGSRIDGNSLTNRSVTSTGCAASWNGRAACETPATFPFVFRPAPFRFPPQVGLAIALMTSRVAILESAYILDRHCQDVQL